MRVLLLSRYDTMGASSRVRYLQYLPYFCAQGTSVSVFPLFSNDYLFAAYEGGSRWLEVVRGYAGRVFVLLKAREYDVVLIEKELFPFLPASWERWLRTIGVPYVVDYDDALFHVYDSHPNSIVRGLMGRKIDSVMHHAGAVLAGNSYLAERAMQAGAHRVQVIPTVVDADRYLPSIGDITDVPIVGWIGSPKTSHYLWPLVPIFEALKRKREVRFVAVGARPVDFLNTPVEVWPWSEESEVRSIQRFDIGIMPLVDSPWERGKCGYKLLQYMACGIPVVGSPVGVNCEIVEEGKNGRLADTPEQWGQVLVEMLDAGRPWRKQLGRAGRMRIINWYSLQVQAPRFYSALKEVCI